jgi:hypothetical protein
MQRRRSWQDRLQLRGRLSQAKRHRRLRTSKSEGKTSQQVSGKSSTHNRESHRRQVLYINSDASSLSAAAQNRLSCRYSSTCPPGDIIYIEPCWHVLFALVALSLKQLRPQRW